MEGPLAALAGYAATLALSLPAAGLLWPRRRRGATLACAIPALAVFPLFWNATGGVAVVVGMSAFLFLLRSLDAAATMSSGTPGSSYVLYCLWLRTHPSEDREPTSPGEPRGRLLRGLFLAAAVALLCSLGARFEVWRERPWLDDGLLAVEVAFGFLAAVDLVTAAAWTFGFRHFLVDAMDPLFALAPSLRAFWSVHWNRPTGAVLRRGIYEPLGGRRAPARGVLAVFAACGLMHAAPLLLADADRAVAWRLAAGAFAFFLAHGLAVLVEGALPHGLRRSALARLHLAVVFALTVPLYPAPLGIALGLHGRPAEAATFLGLLPR